MSGAQNPRVTQADRELAAQIMELQERQEMADLIRAGDRDSSNTVQTVARHREAAEAASKAREAALVEALERIRDCTSKHGGAAEALRIINAALTKEPDA